MWHNVFHYSMRVPAPSLDAFSDGGWAAQTTSAYVSKLADPSSLDKSIVTTPWPSCCSSGVNCSRTKRRATRRAPAQTTSWRDGRSPTPPTCENGDRSP